jgi:hypothetical protein
MNELSGTYISMSGINMSFEMGQVSERYMVSLDGRSKGIAGATSDRAPGWKSAIGCAFWVTLDEFENFINNVLDKNVEWLLGDGKSVPGVWTSCGPLIM